MSERVVTIAGMTPFPHCAVCGLQSYWLKEIRWADNDLETELMCHKCYRWALSADQIPGLFHYDLVVYRQRR